MLDITAWESVRLCETCLRHCDYVKFALRHCDPCEGGGKQSLVNPRLVNSGDCFTSFAMTL